MNLSLTAIFITVSGISSGGYMASQTHIALSNYIQGAAIFAAGPYMCALGSLAKAELECMGDSNIPNVYKLVEITDVYDFENQIDPIVNLKDDSVFIFSGTLDTVISPSVVKQTEEYYKHYVSLANIYTNYSTDSEHCFPTVSYGNQCNVLGSPYMSKCNFDGAGRTLQSLYKNIEPFTKEPSNHRLKVFDQTRFYNPYEYTSLNEFGFIYIPENCERIHICRLHISFHGCLQGWEFISNTYALYSGFNVWAEENDIMILYPYVKSSLDNPKGCWDWWGYTGPEYGTRHGKQIQFIERILRTF